ncbi:hypothetical protein DICPUDRAFT_159808 [Dictyostelium purpureum]|uniref:Uncharacterized protein n=1 Tax=Dictyostelium purpureum TaxID=5786 RepID=F1A510_DICPU|nr:uncharacterized protein DICPUDRAFT_159808 [Dictyostelium purpureum]EGC28717.1 hypothetical protein DICPUDRAFT_159808 [Dictyostelium purpureum]|eukprot:XP_003294754.1 hypothetical protein DICPUDRAFT_159808 [Dictyostelium purpureum]
MYYNQYIPTQQFQPQPQQSDEPLSYINKNNNNSENGPIGVPVAILPPSPVIIQPTISDPLLPNKNNLNINSPSKKLFTDPIFYSVFLGCFSFIASTFSNLISYSSWQTQFNVLGVIISMLSCFLAPILISRIKQKFSMLIGIIVLFIITITLRHSYNRSLISVGISLSAAATQLIMISVFYLLSLTTLESKYKTLLFSLYFLVKYSLSISMQIIPTYNFSNVNLIVPLFILALAFILLLSKPDHLELIKSVYNKKVVECIPGPNVFKNETVSKSIFLTAPIIFYIGLCSYRYITFSYLASALTVIPVGLLVDRYGKKRVFQILLLPGVIFVGLAIVNLFLAYFIGVHYGYNIINTIISISFSVFSSGTMLIIYSMMGEVFPREKLLSGVSTISAFFAIGFLIGYIFNIGAVIYTIGEFVIVLAFIPSSYFFFEYLKNVENK